MSEREHADRRGTVWDWPVPVMIAGALLLLVSLSNGAAGGMLISLLVVAFGLVTWLARRGTFTPRR
jgi:hypothetical protein